MGKLKKTTLWFHSTFHFSHVLRGQKEALNPMELELEAVVRHHVGAGTKPRSSMRATSALTHWALSQALKDSFVKYIYNFFFLIAAASSSWLARAHYITVTHQHSTDLLYHFLLDGLTGGAFRNHFILTIKTMQLKTPFHINSTHPLLTIFVWCHI